MGRKSNREFMNSKSAHKETNVKQLTGAQVAAYKPKQKTSAADVGTNDITELVVASNTMKAKVGNAEIEVKCEDTILLYPRFSMFLDKNSGRKYMLQRHMTSRYPLATGEVDEKGAILYVESNINFYLLFSLDNFGKARTSFVQDVFDNTIATTRNGVSLSALKEMYPDLDLVYIGLFSDVYQERNNLPPRTNMMEENFADVLLAILSE